MATQVVPHVIAFPQTSPAVETISQEELGLLLSLRAQLARTQSQVNIAEEALKSRLRAGVTVENGEHFAEVRRSLRRNPSWKNITRRLAKRLGLDPDQYCSNVIAHTRPSESFSLIVQ